MAEQPIPLLERSLEDFQSALPELEQQGMSQEDINFLRREYARVNSLTGNMDTGPAEGRRAVAGSGGFLSKPEGASGWDALKGLRIEPRRGATGVAQDIEMALTAPGRAAQGTMPAEDMTMEALGTAGMATTGGVAARGSDALTYDPDTMGIFGGSRATDPGYTRAGSQKTPESTGFDGQYRFEIDDSRSVAIPGNLKSFNGSASNVKNLSEVADVFVHDELFYQYPQLASMKIGIDESLVGTRTRGYFQPGDNYIGINPSIASDPNALRSTLTHELQHYVQEIEGFSRGTNVRDPEVSSIASQLYWEHQNKLDEYQRVIDEKVSPEIVIGTLGDAAQVGLDVLESFGVDPVSVIENPGSLRQNYNVPSRIKSSYQSLIESINMAQGKMSTSFGEIASSSDLLRTTQNELDNFVKALATEADPSIDLGSMQGLVDSYRDVFDKYGVGSRLYDLPLDRFKQAKAELETALSNALSIPERPESFFDSAYEAYRRKGGEAEARNAQTRIDFDEQQRFRENPESTEDVPRADQWGFPRGYAEGGLVTSGTAMSDYFRASSGAMSEMDFVGKHKMSTAEFERKFEQENNVDLSGAESLTDIKGSTPMKKQQKGYAEGGMAIDPVSGNEVPPGSLPSEVRDDVDAKLSEGEYVVPADVVRFFGVNFFEQLRDKAKSGMSEMVADERIGGQQTPPQARPQGISPEDVRAVTEMAEGGLVDSSNLDGIIDRVVEAAKTNPELAGIFQKRGIMMAEGGLVTGDTPEFNPAQWSTVGANLGQGQPQGQTQGGGYTYQQFYGPDGQPLMVLFVNGMPAQTIPEGYTTQPPSPEAAAKTAQGRDRDARTPRTPTGGDLMEGGAFGSMGNPLSDLDFSDPESVLGWADQRVAGKDRLSKVGARAVGGVLGGVPGLLGAGLVRGYDEARDVAVINAAAMAAENADNTDLAEQLREKAKTAREEFGLLGLVPDTLMDGDQIFENFMERVDSEGRTLSGDRERTTGSDRVAAASSASPTPEPRPVARGERSTRDGVEYRTTESTDSDGRVTTRSVATGSTAPTASARPVARPTRPQPKTESIEQKINRGGGFNRGGLVKRR